MSRILNDCLRGVVLGLGSLIYIHSVYAEVGIAINRPLNSETCAAPGGLFTLSGSVFAFDNVLEKYVTVTNVAIYRGTEKLGNALLDNPDGFGFWRFPWNPVVAGSSTLKAVGYSRIGTGTVSVTAVFSITNNAPPVAIDVHAQVNINDTNHPIFLSYADTDSDQIWSASIVDNPLHGIISNDPGSTLVYYTPTPGYVGMDSFTYRVSDGITNSNPAGCQLLVHNPTDPMHALVAIVVNSNLFVSVISNEIMRLKSDLEAENYSTKITLWPSSGTSASNVWSCLRNNYMNTNQFFIGAILIGDIPKPWAPNAYNELIYWNMKEFQTISSRVNERHIWVSRINVDTTTWGSEATLIRRALDANHAYRRGQSRLPFTAYRYKNPGWGGDNHYLTNVWPVVEQRGCTSTNLWFLPERADLGKIFGADCMVKGGELFEEESHGNSSGYMSTNSTSNNGWVTKDIIHRNLVQARVCLIGSCSSGVYGGIANEHIFTRGGGCVLSIGATMDSYLGEGIISGDESFLNLLKEGRSWGDALVENFAIKQYANTTLFGDLSLRPMATVSSNSIPKISGFAANAGAGQAVTFTVATSDPDGVVSNIEWFMDGHNGGRAMPTFSGTATNVVYTYPTPGVFTTRVEVIDNLNAHAWREAVVTVNAAQNCVVTVVKSGNGWSSIGMASPASQIIPMGASTQIVFTAADWNRIQSLTTNNITVAAASGMRVYTQAIANISADISNTVTFDLATPVQTGYTNIPTDWLTHWNENEIITDSAFDIYDKYLIGLDPTTSNTFSLHIEALTVSDSNVVIVLKRTYSGGLSPDGMHGQLKLQVNNGPGSTYTNIENTEVTGANVFDDTGRRTYTNAIDITNRFIRAVIR